MSIYKFLDDVGLTKVFTNLKAKLDAKQDALVSGTNIKTINNQSVLGSGNLDISGAFVATYDQTPYADVVAAIDANKPIIVDFPNNHNLMYVTYSTYGAAGSDVLMYAVYNYSGNPALSVITVKSTNAWSITHTSLQELLVSGTNLKTVNGNSLLGSGDLELGDDVFVAYENVTTSLELIAAIDQGKQILVNLEAGEDATGLISATSYYYDPNEVTRNVTISVLWFDWTTTYRVTNNGEWILTRTERYVTESTFLSTTGNLFNLTTDNKSNLVAAINEVYEKSGEPFRVKNWATNSLDVTIVPCTSDAGNTSLAKMVYSIDNVEGADYQIVGMIAYEVFDAASGGNRINCWPVCQFTGNGQKELSVRWMCGGTTNKVAKRINAWVLLKHR